MHDGVSYRIYGVAYNDCSVIEGQRPCLAFKLAPFLSVRAIAYISFFTVSHLNRIKIFTRPYQQPVLSSLRNGKHSFKKNKQQGIHKCLCFFFSVISCLLILAFSKCPFECTSSLLAGTHLNPFQISCTSSFFAGADLSRFISFHPAFLTTYSDFACAQEAFFKNISKTFTFSLVM